MDADELVWAPIPSARLNIDATLRSGQSFRWRRTEAGEWLGVVGDAAVRIRPEAAGFWWQTYPCSGQWERLAAYFGLDVDLDALYGQWIDAEPQVGPAIEVFRGLRILRQPAEEVFFCFLCACCNTIVKITRTIQALERRAGEPLAELDGQVLYRFPSAEAIASVSEAELRGDLWGYRAPRVLALARFLADAGPAWLAELRSAPYGHAQAELAGLPGIGPKIADCICLFGLGHDDAVPVDTHVRRIATRLFRPDLAQRSLTPAVYTALADLFRDRFGAYAGWTQQYLFVEDLGLSIT